MPSAAPQSRGHLPRTITLRRTAALLAEPRPDKRQRLVGRPASRPRYRDRVAVDVETSIEIGQPRQLVAAYAADPDNVTRWYANIKQVTWQTEPPLAVGTQLAFVAQFLGRRLAYTYTVRGIEPGSRFVMSTSQGPFPMTTTYTWADTDTGGTRMTLRNSGQPSGFSTLAAPMMATAMRRANNNDLKALKALLEDRNHR